MTLAELAKVIMDLGPSGIVVLALFVVARKLEGMSDRLITITTGTIDRNTIALTEVRDVMRTCTRGNHRQGAEEVRP